MITRLLCRAKDLTCAVAMDTLSMGGFWIADGQTKTGALLEEWRDEDETYEHINRMTELILKHYQKFGGGEK